MVAFVNMVGFDMQHGLGKTQRALKKLLVPADRLPADRPAGDVLGGAGRLSQTWHVQLTMCCVVISYHLVMLWKARIGRVMLSGSREAGVNVQFQARGQWHRSLLGPFLFHSQNRFFYWNNCAWVSVHVGQLSWSSVAPQMCWSWFRLWNPSRRIPEWPQEQLLQSPVLVLGFYHRIIE